MTKDDIHPYSQFLGVPTWDKPSSPCLSSHFPYGTEITLERLQKIAACELFLQELHFREFRVRDHRDLARIELTQQEINRFFDSAIRQTVVQKFKEIGFSYVSLDLLGIPHREHERRFARQSGLDNPPLSYQRFSKD